MEILLDSRLEAILPEGEYERFCHQVNCLYEKLQGRIDSQARNDLAELLFTLRAVETALTDIYMKDRTEPDLTHAEAYQGSMATLA